MNLNINMLINKYVMYTQKKRDINILNVERFNKFSDA